MKPILFQTEMIRAILEGRKTMTRRIVSKSGYLEEFTKVEIERDVEVAEEDAEDFSDTKILKGLCASFNDGEWVVKCRYDIGDVLWVRETTCKVDCYPAPDCFGKYLYKANGDKPHGKWTPSIFMPREACRIFLEITGVRVERVHEISYNDAIAEGIYSEKDGFHLWFKDYLNVTGHPMLKNNAIGSYKSLWEKINGKESWDLNPWCWVIEFRKTDKPKD